MEILRTDQGMLTKLFVYWKSVGKHIPYFLPVTEEKWRHCLFEDSSRGNRIFKESYIHCIEVKGEVLGFIQFGQPGFCFGPQGNIILEPNIGLIRHLYFNRDRKDVGRELMEAAEGYFSTKGFNKTHGFYHAMGMSCNAGHGKLHQSMGHVEDILRDYGYVLEHENVYYTKEMEGKAALSKLHIKAGEKDQSSKQRFVAITGEEEVGNAEVAYLEESSGFAVDDTIFLNWIGIYSQYKGQGLGKDFLSRVERYLMNKGYRYIHVDTASNNEAAKGLYGTSGFIEGGLTRSYLRER